MNIRKNKNNGASIRIIGLILIVLYLLIGTLGVLDSDNVTEFSKLVPGYTTIGILFIMIISIVYGKDLISSFKDYFAKCGKNFKKVLLYLVIIFILNLVATIIPIVVFGDSYTSTGNYSVIYNTFKYFPWYIIFVTNIYSPFVEEMVFRKSFGDVIKNKTIFILLSGILYGFFHLSSSLTVASFVNGFNLTVLLDSLIAVLPYILFGCTMSYIYIKEKSIAFTIVIKFVYNIFATIISII